MAEKLSIKDWAARGQAGIPGHQVDQEVERGIRKVMSERGLDYKRAMNELFRTNRQLAGRYREAHTAEVV